MSIKEAIISRVKSETENKEREKREPTYVLSREIFRFLQKEFPRITLKQFRDALTELVTEKYIETGETNNDIYIKENYE